jgi:RNA polymerase sigma-70 factor, ECF subfamily
MPVPPDSHDIERLAAAASRGDAVSIEQVLVRYLPRLHAFLRAQIDANARLGESVSDLAQSTCRELLAAGPEFTWQGEARFRSWLFTAALNKVRTRLRRQNTQKRQHGRDDGADLGDLTDLRAALHSPSREAIGNEANEELVRALDVLQPAQREVIALARLAGLPIAEVAQVMGRTESAVRTLLSRSLVALSAVMDRGTEPPAQD